MVLAWCGLDGRLLKPFRPYSGEAFEDIREDLMPLLKSGTDVRMAAGMSLEESMPSVHCTDSYQKHDLQIPELYDEVWQCLQVSSTGVTPRGEVADIGVTPCSPSSKLLSVTGDPRHDVIVCRSCGSVASPDTADSY